MKAVDLIVERAMLAADERDKENRGKDSFIIGIDGHSGAGKSTLAAAVSERLGATLVQMDDFYRIFPDDKRAEFTAKEGADFYFDHERLLCEVLTPLSSGLGARYRAYDWQHNALGEWREVPASRFVILEGVYSCRPEIRPLLPLTVLVHTDPHTRRVRQARRQNSTAWMDRWERAENYYFEVMLPDSGCDVFDMTVSGDSQGEERWGDLANV